MITSTKFVCCFLCDFYWYLKERFGIKSAFGLAKISASIQKKKMDINDAAEHGAEALRDGKQVCDNPFDFETQRELFDAWRDGFVNEKQWWGK